MALEVGDKVIIKDEQEPLTIKDITVYDDFKVGSKVYTSRRLYFEEDHQPEFDWRVTQIIKKGEE